MTKKYRLKVPQLGLPEGTEFAEDKYSGAFYDPDREILLHNSIVTNPDLFEPVIERWKPEYYQRYYYIRGNLAADYTERLQGNPADDSLFVAGNCFRTKDQAEEAARRIKDTLMNYHKEIGEWPSTSSPS